MKKFPMMLLCGAVLIAVSACAKNPDAIAPVTMSSNAYDRLSCQEAIAQRTRVDSELTTLSAQQRGAVTGDAIGVFLIGVPMSSLTGGDKEGLIAARKGEKLALDARLMNCGAPA